ncbi:MAG: hypothetical protein GVY25_04525 [Bacteroidetes bacterium]|jgi:hypothetical protein|nr:hypothetical protein [Bacteroidota bacterium]
MSDATRRLLIDRLDDLGEFDRAVPDATRTQYDRAREREAGLSTEWVETRRDELESAAWTYWSMIFGILTAPFLILLLFSEMTGWNGGVPEIAVVVAGIVAIAGAAYRISTFMNYVRRRQLYDLLYDWDTRDSISDSANHTATPDAVRA